VQETTTNVADLDWVDARGNPVVGSFSFAKLNGYLADADATIVLTPDGRLSSINATSSGEGDTIIKDLVTVAGTAATLAPPAGRTFVETAEDRACKVVDSYSAVGAKPDAPLVTLTYSLPVSWSITPDHKAVFVVNTATAPAYDAVTRDQVTLIPDPASKPVFDRLATELADRMTSQLKIIDARPRMLAAPTVADGSTGAQLLELTRVAMINVGVFGHAGDMMREDQMWSGLIAVPTHETYTVPVPSPAVFGKTAFGIALSDSGSIASLHYGSNSGAPDALDALGAIAGAFKPSTGSDKAKELGSQADLIAAQQRLIRCEVNPTACT